MKKTAVITFDYEVFLGRNTGTVENSVLKPTWKILELLKENNGKAIFFVDAAWLLFIMEKYPGDFILVRQQLKSIVESGSSVELHLHPQWLKAEKTEEGIRLSSGEKYYKLHALGDEEIYNLFRRGKELLESITDDTITCFRAGGWCIEPFERLRVIFERLEIKYDFSVAPGLLLNEGKAYDFDYSRAPRLPFYRFNDDVQNPEKEGRFTEVTVSTYQNNPAYRLVNKILLWHKKDKIFGDGKGIKEKPEYSFRTLQNRLKLSKAMLTIDKTDSLFFRYLLSTHFRKSDFIVIVSHPKTTSDTALKNLACIIKRYNTLSSADLNKFMNYS
jgi:peptidoglycan/xylan/chitin deacetylase (PgdA/CDA1 family)